MSDWACLRCYSLLHPAPGGGQTCHWFKDAGGNDLDLITVKTRYLCCLYVCNSVLAFSFLDHSQHCHVSQPGHFCSNYYLAKGHYFLVCVLLGKYVRPTLLSFACCCALGQPHHLLQLLLHVAVLWPNLTIYYRSLPWLPPS